MTTEHSRTLVFRDVRVFDGAEVLPRQDVITQDGIVVQVRPTGSQIPEGDIVDGTGRTLLPGLVDAHLHLPPSPEAALRQLLELGVTTVFDMFSGGEVLDSINRIAATDPPHLASPFTSGTGATAPGSALEKMTRQPLPTVSHPRDAAAWVDARLREGSDYVKIIYDDREGGRLDLSTLKALIEAAHHRGARAVVHAITEQTAREAITAGADGLAHLFIGPDVSPDFGACAADHDVFVIPTLGVLRGMCGERPNLALAADPRLARYVDVRPPVPVRPADATRSHLYSAATAALAQLVTAHVRVLAGTDTGIPTAALGVFA
ncbi:MAG TPA: amidohydrolase family protein [Cellulomonas sp.]|uniref:amidohydrolase family protein n=1 Tax=Cellulomonas sp. TaxID=40001 RepID=UPI002E353867|nr:amidohydrolase family protein [Cellulomonas sp.]HEX5334101.1 amidohydrolase family protein [Cellulomonas sp.]